MSYIAEQTLSVFERLDEASQMSVLKFAEFLMAESCGSYLPYDAAEMDEDISLYDEAKANDDGYRISSKDLREKYGI